MIHWLGQEAIYESNLQVFLFWTNLLSYEYHCWRMTYRQSHMNFIRLMKLRTWFLIQNLNQNYLINE